MSPGETGRCLSEAPRPAIVALYVRRTSVHRGGPEDFHQGGLGAGQPRVQELPDRQMPPLLQRGAVRADRHPHHGIRARPEPARQEHLRGHPDLPVQVARLDRRLRITALIVIR